MTTSEVTPWPDCTLHKQWHILACITVVTQITVRTRVCYRRGKNKPLLHSRMHYMVQRWEDVIKADPFFGRSRAQFRVPPLVSNTFARDRLA